MVSGDLLIPTRLKLQEIPQLPFVKLIQLICLSIESIFIYKNGCYEIAVILFLLFPLTLFAQDDNQEVKLSKNVQDSIPGTAIVLKDYTTIFEKIYSSELEKEELAAEIKMYLPAVKNFQLTRTENQSAYQLSGRLTDYIANYTRFDVKAYYDSFPLKAPINANVLISIKIKIQSNRL